VNHSTGKQVLFSSRVRKLLSAPLNLISIVIGLAMLIAGPVLTSMQTVPSVRATRIWAGCSSRAFGRCWWVFSGRCFLNERLAAIICTNVSSL